MVRLQNPEHFMRAEETASDYEAGPAGEYAPRAKERVGKVVRPASDEDIFRWTEGAVVLQRAVLPAAVIIGLCSEILKFLYLLALPWLNFQEVYGPFALSISLMFWAFLSGMLLLAGAYISAEGHFRR